MSPVSSGNRAKIMIRIGELASRLGSLERQMDAAHPNTRPIMEVGVTAIRRELSDLSRRLK